MQRCRDDDPVGHVRDFGARDAGQGLRNCHVEIGDGVTSVLSAQELKDLLNCVCRQSSTFSQLDHLNEGNAGNPDSMLPLVGLSQDLTRHRRQPSVTGKVPIERVRICDVLAHGSGVAKRSHISRRTSAISSSSIRIPRQRPSSVTGRYDARCLSCLYC